MRVAVIGAGVSGLTAIKCCLDEGLDVVCYEQRDDIAGLWNYKEDIEDGLSTVMRGTVSNNCKELLGYSDMPFPREFPIYVPHALYLKYLRMYADKFDLWKHIRFNTEVVLISRAADFETTGRWEVTVKDKIRGGSGGSDTVIFDAVLVCNGHESERDTLQLENQQNFRGKVIHSQQYRDNRGYAGKRVVVVGIGNSGCDVACELADVCEQVYISAHRGVWLLSRVGHRGEPHDLQLFGNRFMIAISEHFPESFLDRMFSSILSGHLDHELYGFKPSFGPLDHLPTANDYLPSKMMNGAVKLKPGVRRLTETGVEFIDGSMVDNIEAVICATGYRCSYSFMEKSLGMEDGCEADFYRLMFPTNVNQPTIAFISVPMTISISVLAEIQCRYATRVFKGLIKLPDASVMRREAEKDKMRQSRLYIASKAQFRLRSKFPIHTDELAREIGCMPPSFVRLLLTDPRLALAVYLGPPLSSHYRLVGPGAWSGARDAILASKERITYPLTSGRQLNGEKSCLANASWCLMILCLALLLMVCFRWLF